MVESAKRGDLVCEGGRSEVFEVITPTYNKSVEIARTVEGVGENRFVARIVKTRKVDNLWVLIYAEDRAN